MIGHTGSSIRESSVTMSPQVPGSPRWPWKSVLTFILIASVVLALFRPKPPPHVATIDEVHALFYSSLEKSRGRPGEQAALASDTNLRTAAERAMDEALRSGSSAIQAARAAQAVYTRETAALIQKLISKASDPAVRAYAQANADFFGAMRSQPAACFYYLTGTSLSGPTKPVEPPAELTERRQRADDQVILSALQSTATPRVPDEAQTKKLMAQMLRPLLTTYSKEEVTRRLQDLSEGAKAKNAAELCETTVGMYSGALAMPTPDGEDAIRLLLSP